MQFRKKRTLAKYYEYKKTQEKEVCNFCIGEHKNKTHAFAYWKILKNLFPYDYIAEEHDLLIPKRHFRTESEMTHEEWKELVFIKTTILPKHNSFDIILENFEHMRSVEHYHLHLLKFKEKK
jgi:diadenosine tetraphosphate (Ap4A) HIT family hydrolase